MKTFKQIRKIQKPLEFFAHFKSASDPRHAIEDEEIPTFFAHFKSGINPKHKIKDGLDESKKMISANKMISTNSPDLKKTEKTPNLKKPAITSYEVSRKNISHHKTIPISDNHEETLNYYTDDSQHINEPLVNKKTPDSFIRKMIPHLDKITRHKENKLPGPVTSYSGIHPKFGKMLSGVKIGEKVKSPAYISSSLDKDIANSFSTHKSNIFSDKGNFDQHMVVFHLPKGHTKARHIDHVSRWRGEDELLHARGQTFKKIGEHREDVISPEGRGERIHHHLTPV